MKDNSFDLLWLLLEPDIVYANRKQACYKIWQRLTKLERDRIYGLIFYRKAKHKFVDYNPYFAITKSALFLNIDINKPQN
jgi:hypothetical protein